MKYNHMSFGGPPVKTETVEEADELLKIDENDSEIGIHMCSLSLLLYILATLSCFLHDLMVWIDFLTHTKASIKLGSCCLQ